MNRTARGVYYAPFLHPDGARIAFAVDSQGHRIAEVTIQAHDRLVLDWLRELLDLVDSVEAPRLALVKGGAS